MRKVCPRCREIFECNKNSVKECGCSSVLLNSQAIKYIKERFADKCLCVACLNKILSIFAVSQSMEDALDQKHNKQ